jgi:hypothetical protein
MHGILNTMEGFNNIQPVLGAGLKDGRQKAASQNGKN